MIEKPEIEDGKIIDALNQNYSIQAVRVDFLPIGNDSSAFSYRVDTRDGVSYFLKLKENLSNLAGLFVPRFLKDSGIRQVVAPLATITQELWTNLDRFSLILYPFVAGREAMQVGMSDSQWMKFGSALKQVHSAELPPDLSQYVKRETFIPKWSTIARELDEQVHSRKYDAPVQKELARFWRENSQTVHTVIERTERIGKDLQQADLEFVLCHADIHTANILLTQENKMFIVDWDDALLAPKERDLMFVLGMGAKEENSFFNGYGNVEINQLALAYYRYEWCVQEIGDFGGRVFLAKNGGEDTKQNAVAGFKQLFARGDVIEGALNTPFESEIRDHS